MSAEGPATDTRPVAHSLLEVVLLVLATVIGLALFGLLVARS